MKNDQDAVMHPGQNTGEGNNQSFSSDGSNQKLQLDDNIDGLDHTFSAASAALNEPKLTIFQTSLALIATNIGAGIVGIPYAFYNLGLTLGILTICAYAFVAWIAVILMLKAKDLSPRHYESLYELGYLLMGKPAIYAICGVILLQCMGVLMVYFIIFGDTMSEVFRQMVTGSDITGIMSEEEVLADLETKSPAVQAFCTRSAFVVFSAAILAPALFKKEMKEMKIFSYLLFLAVIVIVIITGYDLATLDKPISEVIDFTEVMSPKPGHGAISSLAILSVAFVFHMQVFPAYTQLEKKSTARFSQASAITILICLVTYTSLGVLCLLMYGSQLGTSFLHNVSEKPGYASLFIRLVFAGLLLVHIPYIFLPAKEAILLIYFEHKQNFLSEHLDKKLAEEQEATKKRDKGEESEEEDETDPMVSTKQESDVRHRQRGDTINENDKDEESEGSDKNEGIEVEKVTPQEKNNLLDESCTSVSVSFVSDINKFLPAVEALYIDEVTYFYSSLIAHLIVVMGALFVQDIRTIFDFIGAIGGCSILFWFPSVIFLLMLKKYGRSRHHKSFEYTFYQVMAYLLFILGVASFSLEMYANMQNLSGGHGEGHSESTEVVDIVSNPE